MSIKDLRELIGNNNKNDMKDLSVEFTEILLDSFVDNGIKEIPLLKTIFATASTITSAIFLKKLLLFLENIEETSVEQRQKLINKVKSSGKYRSSVGETLLEYLNKVESDYKPEIIGKMFVAVINSKITYDEFLKSIHVLCNVYSGDLLELKDNTNENNEVLYSIPSEIFMNGLTDTDYLGQLCNSSGEKIDDSIKKLTRIGYIIIKIGLA